MRHCAFVALGLLLSASASGCAPATSDPEALRGSGQSIYNGTADTTTDAVMAMGIDLGNGQGAACSGTVIAVKGSSGYYLTAAHCVVDHDSNDQPIPGKVLQPSQLYILPGTDYQKASTAYPVVEIKKHPSYDGVIYDFAVVRFSFSGAAPAVIPAMSAAEDTLKAGTKLDVIGYGQTDKNPQNSVRNHAQMTISSFDANGALVYLGENDNTSITCQGDSGGPGMFGSGASKRVATVTSFGFQAACVLDTAGVGRVSKVYASFIKPYLDGSTGVLSCDECQVASQQPGGKCAAQADACQKDTDCLAFIECANACTTDACAQKCQTDHAQGVATYVKILDCGCDTGCPTECADDQYCKGSSGSCGFTVDPPDAPGCNACVEAKCCDVDKACYDDPACNACAQNPQGAGCSTNAKLNALQACISGPTCGLECGGSSCGFSYDPEGYPECDACVQASCCDVNKACFGDPECNACAQNPQGAGCADNAKLKAFFACIDGPACGAKCGASTPAKCGFTAGAACQTCFEGACCDQFSACAADDLCTACATGDKKGAECDPSALYAAANKCLSDSCASECGGGQGGAGGAAGQGGASAGGQAGGPAAGAGGASAGSGGASAGQAGSSAGTGDEGGAGGTDPEGGPGGSDGEGGSGTAGKAGSAGKGTGGSKAGAGTSEGGSGGTTAAEPESSGSDGGCSAAPAGTGALPAPTALLSLAAVGLLARRRRSRG